MVSVFGKIPWALGEISRNHPVGVTTRRAKVAKSLGALGMEQNRWPFFWNMGETNMSPDVESGSKLDDVIPKIWKSRCSGSKM